MVHAQSSDWIFGNILSLGLGADPLGRRCPPKRLPGVARMRRRPPPSTQAVDRDAPALGRVAAAVAPPGSEARPGPARGGAARCGSSVARPVHARLRNAAAEALPTQISCIRADRPRPRGEGWRTMFALSAARRPTYARGTKRVFRRTATDAPAHGRILVARVLF